ncbi:PAS domain S-box protein [Microcella sp.]|uniref:PAS domain-containing hybrid sensor histidine kinase/response regulator n=1 Tax=Microcella sp. TaxID=1913979 RepID=UPI00299F6737|nr:PAS domain S-box protein [Microcella sp.]MDX2026268.1 PAS domain S-box protein [Microcella sp.]
MTAQSARARHELTRLVDALRIATRHSPDAAFVIDSEKTLQMANPHLCAALGRSEHELTGRPFDLSARSTDPVQVHAALATSLGGETARYRATGTMPGGDAFVAEVTLMPLRIDDEVVGVFGTSSNLTAIERHDREARRSDDLVRLAGRLARFGGWSVDADSGAIALSAGAREILGIDPALTEITALAWARFPDHDRTVMEALLHECLTAGSPFEIEAIMFSTTGDRLTIRTIGEAERDGDGRVVRAYGAIWDVTDIAAARERERALEARLSLTLNSIADGIIFAHADGVISFVNQHATELIRRTEVEALSVTLNELFAGDQGQGFRECFATALATSEQRAYRGVMFAPDYWIECTAFPTSDGLAVYVRDVTDDEHSRRVARHAQAQVEQQAALLDAARDAIIVRDLDYRVHYWNKAAEELYGWSRDEAMGRRVSELIYDDTAQLDRASAITMRDGYFADEVHQITRDGRQLVVDCRWQVIPNPDGDQTLILAVNSDITEWRREQDARRRAERMEALGTLAGGIAHDLNNMLTPILMSVQLLALDEEDAGRRELLASTETAVKRGADMVRQVLSFVRGVDGRRIEVNVDHVVDEFVAITRDLLPPGIDLTVTRARHLSGTIGDPTQLVQVLVNLATNARDAMDDSGHLTITADELDVDEGYLSVSHPAAPGRYIIIGVEDSGHGMTAEVQEKIFEPFFTTKPPGRGTGLGLATSLAIIRSHGGFMQVYSEIGHGSRFVVGLPVDAHGEREHEPPAESASALPRGDGDVILVVDDDDDISRVAAATLEANGYRTLTARNGREAIDLIESGAHSVDLVLTDMMMPVMDGAATSAYLEENHPNIPIIAASGFTAGSGSASIGLGIARFIAKPYTTSHLLTSIRDTLREHRSAGRVDDE